MSTPSRLLGAAFWGALLTAAVVVAFALLVYVSNARVLRRTLTPGAVQRTGFGESAFVTSNAHSSSRILYRAVTCLEVHQGFVFIRFQGHPLVRVYPQVLFPDAELARIQSARS